MEAYQEHCKKTWWYADSKKLEKTELKMTELRKEIILIKRFCWNHPNWSQNQEQLETYPRVGQYHSVMPAQIIKACA